MDFHNQIECCLLKFDNFDGVGLTKVGIKNPELEVDVNTTKEDVIYNLSKVDEDFKLNAIEDFISPPTLNSKYSNCGNSKFEH